MPDFSELFEENNWQPLNYNGKVVIRGDKFPVNNGDVLLINIESTKASRPQGMYVDISGYCEIENKIYKDKKGIKAFFWENSIIPMPIKIKVFTDKGFVYIQNVWEETDHRGSKSNNYGYFGSAMIVEEIENGRRYYCNDGEPDDDFDDIIFTVRKKV